MKCDPYCATILRATTNYMCCRNSKPNRTTRTSTEASIMDTSAARPALYSTRTPFLFVDRRAARNTVVSVPYVCSYGTVLLCTFTKLYGTSTVPYCTVHRPLFICLYEYHCTALVPYFTSNIILRARRSTVEVQYSSEPYVFSQKYGTVVHIY